MDNIIDTVKKVLELLETRRSIEVQVYQFEIQNYNRSVRGEVSKYVKVVGVEIPKLKEMLGSVIEALYGDDTCLRYCVLGFYNDKLNIWLNVIVNHRDQYGSIIGCDAFIVSLDEIVGKYSKYLEDLNSKSKVIFQKLEEIREILGK